METSARTDWKSREPRRGDACQVPGKEEGEGVGREDDLAASLEEIEKLDVMLKIKVTEEKRAKLSRIQTEEESRNLLSRLPRFKVPDRIQINVEQFMDLLNEVVQSEAASSQCFKLNEAEATGGDAVKKEENKERKRCRQQQNAGQPTFVERNIRLAKCGRGTLSLTDEEKLRIETLLDDIEPPKSETTAEASKESQASRTDAEDAEEFYAIDHETKTVLSEIDQRLQMLGKLKTLQGVRSKVNAFEDDGQQTVDKGTEGEKKRVGRLEEINKLLNSMNLASNEEINPLSEEEMERLVRQSKDSLRGAEGERDLPQEVLAQLVSCAKSLMPKFKYRFDDA